MTTDLQSRTEASLALLDQFLARNRALTPVRSRLLDLTHEGVATVALGGKHLRSRLVHLSAGEVGGGHRHAATVFGASVDLLHAAFLIHDDIIDEDDLRRGQPTIHARVRRESGDAHLGTSIALAAGDLALNGAVQLLVEADLDEGLVRPALVALTAAVNETVTGEILDVAHRAQTRPEPELVRMSNLLKTGEYSFGLPLKLGALAAGRDPAAMGPLAQALGAAYQAADDIAGAHAGNDIEQHRVTLVTVRLAAGRDLAGATSGTAAEGGRHLAEARAHIDAAGLPGQIRDGLHGITDRIGATLRAHL